MQQIRKESNSALRQKVRGDQSPESLIERISRMKDPVTNEVKNPEFVAPIASDSDWMTKVQYAISGDPRTRRQGEDLAALSLRRNEAFTESFQAQEAKKADSTDFYEQKISHDLKAMGIEEGYRTYIPDWAIRDED